MKKPEPKTCQCPCGEILNVPIVEDEFNGGFCYEPLNIHCPKCKRHSTWGNSRTGEVYDEGWITAADAAASQAEYERQCFEADNNELYGRGNW